MRKLAATIVLALLLISCYLITALAAKELVTRPDVEGGNIEGLAVRGSPAVGSRVLAGQGYDGANALYVFSRNDIDNSPIFFAPSVVKDGKYNITAYIKLEEDPGPSGQLVQLCYAVQSIGKHFVTLPCSDREDGSLLITDTEWTKIEIKDFKVEIGSENPINDFGMFIVTWGGKLNYYISNVSVVDPNAVEETSSEASSKPADETPSSSTLSTTSANKSSSSLAPASSHPKDGNPTALIIVIAAVSAGIIVVAILYFIKKKKHN